MVSFRYLPTVSILEFGDIIMCDGDRESVVQNKFLLNMFCFELHLLNHFQFTERL